MKIKIDCQSQQEMNDWLCVADPYAWEASSVAMHVRDAALDRSELTSRDLGRCERAMLRAMLGGE